MIIPVYCRAALTRQCLDTVLERERPECEFEVVVVDDASADATPGLLASYGDRIRVVTHGRNMGFAAACNDGAAVATGRDLVFLNNDTIPLRGWLDALVRYADAHPGAAVVGSKLLSPWGTVQHAGVAICQDRAPRHLYAGFPGDHPAVNRSRRVQIVTAACVLIRRDVFGAAEGFDRAFINGYEDVDLCLRLGERGHEVHYCHDSVLVHLESVSEGRLLSLAHNNELYRERWLHRVQPDDWRYYLEDGLIQVTYGQGYPLEMAVSPALAVLKGEEWCSEANRLLTYRAEQVFELMRENIRCRADHPR